MEEISITVLLKNGPNYLILPYGWGILIVGKPAVRVGREDRPHG